MATNSNTTKPASGAAPGYHIPNYETFTIETVIDGLWDLYHLIDSASVALVEKDYILPDGRRDRELDRISSLVSLARAKARDLHNELADRSEIEVSTNAGRAAA